MKTTFFLFLFLTIFGATNFAQKAKLKTPALPVGISNWSGEDSDKITNNKIIRMRLKKLLGTKNYASLMELFETINPIEKNEEVLFVSGCLIHACGHLESAIAVDLAHNTVHAAIYKDGEKTKFFNEKGSQTPPAIINWAERLDNPKEESN